MNNGTDIQMKWIQKIVENYPKYNPDWLLTGKEPMLKGETQQANKPEDMEVMRIKLELYEKILKEKERTIGLLEDLNLRPPAPQK